MEKAGRLLKTDALQEIRRRQKPLLAEQRRKLIQGGDERDRVDRGQTALEDQPYQPESVGVGVHGLTSVTGELLRADVVLIHSGRGKYLPQGGDHAGRTG